MVKHIPTQLSDVKPFEEHFAELYPGQVRAIHIVWDISQYIDQVTKEDKNVSLEKVNNNAQQGEESHTC